MAIDGVTAGQGLTGGGTSGNVPVGLNAPVGLLNGGTGVSAFSAPQMLNAVGALPTAGGTMSGNLTVAGGIVVGDPPGGNLGAGTLNVHSTIVVNTTSAPLGTLPTGTHLAVEGDDGGRILLGAHNDQPFVNPILTLRRSRGTGAGPQRVETGDGLGNIAFVGHDGTNYQIRRAGLLGVALESWTPTAQGASLIFETTAIGDTNLVRSMELRQGLIVGSPTGPGDQDKGPGSINAQAIYVNGTSISGSAGLPLTGGTLSGPGNLAMDGGLVVGAPADGNLGAGTVNVQNLLRVNASGAPMGAVPPGTHLVIESDDGTRFLWSAHGGTPTLSMRHSLGTGITPQPTAATNDLALLAFAGYGTPGGYLTRSAGIRVTALDNFTDTARGTELNFETTASGAASVTVSMIVRSDLLYVPGDIDVGGTVLPSDRRLKQNIEPWECGLESVRRLNPISYQYNGLGGTIADGRTRVGLDADETRVVIPEMVGTRRSAYIDGTPVKTISPGTLTFALINAVKELAARLEALEGSH